MSLQTQEEFFQLYLSPVDDLDRIWQASVTHSVSDGVSYPDAVDWRSEGCVTSVCKLWRPTVNQENE